MNPPNSPETPRQASLRTPFAPSAVWRVRTAVAACLVTATCPLAAQPAFSSDPPDLTTNALSPGDSAEGVLYTLEEGAAEHEGAFDARWLEQPLGWASRQTDALAEKTGLRLGVAYTMLFQQATEGDGDLYGGSGDLDIMASWTFIGRGTENTGRLVAGTEYRYRIGSQPASALGGQVGTLLATTGGFNDRYWAVRDVYWVQRLFDGQLRFLIGRGDASEFHGSHSLQGINGFFSNRHFSANNTAPYPDFTPMVGVSVRPGGDLFYATVGAANAYGNATHPNFDTLEEGEFFLEAEVGITPMFEGLGRARFAIAPWHMPSRNLTDQPEDWGLAFIAEQQFGDHLRGFARYGHADEALTNIRNSFQVGGGYQGPFGRDDDLAGLAFGYAEPSRETSRDEKAVELFYRWQVTGHSHLTLGFQAIFDPGNTLTRDSLGVVSGRYRVAF